MEDILDSEKLHAVGPEVFRFYIRLLAMLNRTKRRDGAITLDRYSLNACAMREQHRAAVRVAREGAEAGLYLLREEGATVHIRVRNWSELQGLAPSTPPQAPSSPPPPTPTPTPTPSREGSAPPAGTPDAGIGRTPESRRTRLEKPDTFPADSKERLRAWGKRKGYSREILNAGLDRFRDWVPQKPPHRRTIEQWESSFKTITRKSVEDGSLGRAANPDRKPKGQAYVTWKGHCVTREDIERENREAAPQRDGEIQGNRSEGVEEHAPVDVLPLVRSVEQALSGRRSRLEQVGRVRNKPGTS